MKSEATAIAIGVLVGVAIGALLNNIAIGIVLGLALGIALGPVLARALRLKGMYAFVDLPERTGNQVRCALEKAEDAVLFGQAVAASLSERSSDWASQRVFRYDDNCAAAIEAMLRDQRSSKPKRRTANIL